MEGLDTGYYITKYTVKNGTLSNSMFAKLNGSNNDNIAIAKENDDVHFHLTSKDIHTVNNMIQSVSTLDTTLFFITLCTSKTLQNKITVSSIKNVQHVKAQIDPKYEILKDADNLVNIIRNMRENIKNQYMEIDGQETGVFFGSYLEQKLRNELNPILFYKTKGGSGGKTRFKTDDMTTFVGQIYQEGFANDQSIHDIEFNVGKMEVENIYVNTINETEDDVECKFNLFLTKDGLYKKDRITLSGIISYALENKYENVVVIDFSSG
jgi:hypothetical protein